LPFFARGYKQLRYHARYVLHSILLQTYKVVLPCLPYFCRLWCRCLYWRPKTVGWT